MIVLYHVIAAISNITMAIYHLTAINSMSLLYHHVYQQYHAYNTIISFHVYMPYHDGCTTPRTRHTIYHTRTTIPHHTTCGHTGYIPYYRSPRWTSGLTSWLLKKVGCMTSNPAKATFSCAKIDYLVADRSVCMHDSTRVDQGRKWWNTSRNEHEGAGRILGGAGVKFL